MESLKAKIQYELDTDSQEEVKKVETNYSILVGDGEETDIDTFKYATTLIRSNNIQHISKGVNVIRDLIDNHKMEKDVACSSLYYLAHGLYKLQKYNESEDEVDRLLLLQENYPNAKNLKDLCQLKHGKEGFISRIFKKKKKRVIAPPPVVMSDDEVKIHIENEKKRRLKLASKYATQGPELDEEALEEQTRKEEMMRFKTMRTLRQQKIQKQGLGGVQINSSISSQTEIISAPEKALFNEAPLRPSRLPPVALLEKAQDDQQLEEKIDESNQENKKNDRHKKKDTEKQDRYTKSDKKKNKRHSKRKSSINDNLPVYEEHVQPEVDQKEINSVSESPQNESVIDISDIKTEVKQNETTAIEPQIIADPTKDETKQIETVESQDSKDETDENKFAPPRRPSKPSSVVIEKIENMSIKDEANFSPTNLVIIKKTENTGTKEEVDIKPETPSVTKEHNLAKSTFVQLLDSNQPHTVKKSLSVQPPNVPPKKAPQKLNISKGPPLPIKKTFTAPPKQSNVEKPVNAPLKVNNSPKVNIPPKESSNEVPRVNIPPEVKFPSKSNDVSNNTPNTVNNAPKKTPGKLNMAKFMPQNNEPQPKPKLQDIPIQNNSISDQKKNLASLLAKGPPMGVPGYSPKLESSSSLDDDERLDATDNEERVVTIDESGLPTNTDDHILHAVSRAKGPKRRPPRR